jgi:hypothetical protein
MEGLSQYIRILKKKHSELITCWELFVKAITSGDVDRVQPAAEVLRVSVEKLQELVPKGGAPEWIEPMHTLSTRLSNQQTLRVEKHRYDNFIALARLEPQLRGHDFGKLQGDEPSYLVNLDDLTKKHHDQDKINELYDKAINIIQETLDGGTIDSKRINDDLQKILNTIKVSRSSSFLNQRWQTPNLKRFLGAVVKVSAKKIPVLNTVLEIIEEADKTLEKSNDEILQEMKIALDVHAETLKNYIDAQPLLNSDTEKDNSEWSMLIEGDFKKIDHK